MSRKSDEQPVRCRFAGCWQSHCSVSPCHRNGLLQSTTGCFLATFYPIIVNVKAFRLHWSNYSPKIFSRFIIVVIMIPFLSLFPFVPKKEAASPNYRQLRNNLKSAQNVYGSVVNLVIVIAAWNRWERTAISALVKFDLNKR